MSELLGMPLDTAVERLTQKGFRVETMEARSRKGSGGNDARVLCEESLPDGGVRVTYAWFVTEPEADRPE